MALLQQNQSIPKGAWDCPCTLNIHEPVAGAACGKEEPKFGGLTTIRNPPANAVPLHAFGKCSHGAASLDFSWRDSLLPV